MEFTHCSVLSLRRVQLGKLGGHSSRRMKHRVCVLGHLSAGLDTTSAALSDENTLPGGSQQ